MEAKYENIHQARENTSGRELKKAGPTEIRTRITGFRVLGANHYTMGPL